MTSRRMARIGVVAACVLVASPTRVAIARPADACKLLTPAQVGAALGARTGAGQAIGSTGCQWSAQSARVTLVLYDASGWQTMNQPLPGVSRTTLGGVGDDAVYSTVGSLTTLSVKKGDSVFVVRVYGVHPQANQMAVERSLAQDALANP